MDFGRNGFSSRMVIPITGHKVNAGMIDSAQRTFHSISHSLQKEDTLRAPPSGAAAAGDIGSSSSSSLPWNLRIRELTESGRHAEALALYRRMLRPPNPPPDAFTFPSAIQSAAALSLPAAASQLHSHALKAGCIIDPFVLTSLITAYSRLSLLPRARLLLHDISSPSVPTLVVCYNALISAHALHSLPSAALSLFRRMRRAAIPFNSVTLLALLPSCSASRIPSLHACAVRSLAASVPSVANCLLSAYAKAGDVNPARQVFDEMPSPRELIAWNAMISAYSQNGLAPRVIDLYRDMKRSGDAQPDAVTLVCVLSSCANLGAHVLGRDIDACIAANPAFSSNMFLKNALINMHARCGDLARARQLFDGMLRKSIVSWTAIIAGYGMHGQGDTALRLFDEMVQAGVRPDGVAMVSILSACSHSGMTDKGLQCFYSMESAYGVTPRSEHYACIVDLLGRAGRLEFALELIRSMPMEPDGAVWGSLLGACKIHKNVKIGELAFEHVIELEPTNVGYYVLMSNIYSDAGMLSVVVRIRAMMRQRGLRKDPGCSYTEHKGMVHLFLADDHSHPQAKSIYEMIANLEALAKGDCAVKMTNMDKMSDNKEQQESDTVVGIHSEKLAIAFGLLNSEAEAEIVVIKNLRVCQDCHSFLKVISKITNRKMVVRDASRFHHFEGGLCSCKDYW